MLREVLEHVDRLKLENQKLRKARYGRLSEKIAVDQLALRPGGARSSPDGTGTSGAAARERRSVAPPTKRRGSTGRRELPADLPREERVYEPAAAECQCAVCGVAKSVIGYETSEELEYVPATLKVIVHKRAKYACRPCQGEVVVAPAPPKVIDKGLPGPGLLAAVTLSKYGHGLPLNRQEAIWELAGHRLPRSTTAGWVEATAELLAPVVERIRVRALSAHVLHCDDTGICVLDRDHPKGSKRGHLWVYLGDEEWAVYDYTPNWTKAGPVRFLAERRGWLVADGYAGFDEVFERPEVRAAGCWAHARRYFVEALESGPLIHGLGQWLAATANDESVEPKSPLRQAVGYTLGRWPALLAFLEDGRVPMTNNAAERALRRIAVGRKNWLFAGSDAGAQRAAIAYSVLATCQLQGVEPWSYLRDVLAKIAAGWPARRIDELLPDRWAAENPELVGARS
ncbi:MAG: IS66 family transposase [Deltaproteobacteria bacterium]|nr:IS66 family transposase [Deltaproteobacteria bacterium]